MHLHQRRLSAALLQKVSADNSALPDTSHILPEVSLGSSDSVPRGKVKVQNYLFKPPSELLAPVALT